MSLSSFSPSRRQLLAGVGLTGVALAIGGGQAGAATIAAAPAATGPFSPGMLHTPADVARIKAALAAGDPVVTAGWNRLVANGRSRSTWVARPLATVVRGGGVGENYMQFAYDVHAAYQNALRWRISGVTAHGDTARNILNAWTGTLTTVTGSTDRYLAAGIYGYQFANACELMRGYAGFDLDAARRLLRNVFYPLNNDFLTRHNNTCISHYWANWDQCSLASVMAIGILCDERALFDQAIDYLYNGGGNGALRNAMPFLHGTTMAQWQESGRDQGHTMMGIGMHATICEMAWNQGVDLYGYDDNRFLKAAEYVAAYNLGQTVPFTTYSWGFGDSCAPRQHTVISDVGRGQQRPVWEMVHNHYVRRSGLTAANVSAMAAQVRVEGGGGDYGQTSGGYDSLGFGSLLSTSALVSGFPVAGTEYRLVARHSGKVADVYAWRTADGSDIVQWALNYGANQKWTFISVGGGYYKIKGVHSGKLMEVAGLSRADGGNVALREDVNAHEQHWAVTPTGDGYFLLTNRLTGKALNVSGASVDDGANIDQWAYNALANEQWQIVPS